MWYIYYKSKILISSYLLDQTIQLYSLSCYFINFKLLLYSLKLNLEVYSFIDYLSLTRSIFINDLQALFHLLLRSLFFKIIFCSVIIFIYFNSFIYFLFFNNSSLNINTFKNYCCSLYMDLI